MRADIRSLIEQRYKFVLAGLAALAALFGITNMLLFNSLKLTTGQTPSWWEIIENVETGEGYKSCQKSYVPNCELTNQYTAIREPVPIFLFALVGRLTHDSETAFQLVQIAIVLFILPGVFLLGRELGGLSAGLVAATMWAFYIPAMSLENEITGDLLEGLFVVYGFLKFVHVLKRGGTRDWIAFGLLFGLAVLSRSAALILVVTLGLDYLACIYMWKRSSAFVQQSWFRKAFISVIAFVLVLSPWVIRNWIVFGEPVVGTTLTGYTIYRHNAILAKDVPPHYVGPEEGDELVQELAARRPELMTPLNEAQVNDLFKQEFNTLIKAHPFKYIMLSAYRFLPLWFNISVREGYGNEMTKWDYLTIPQQAILLVAFILGLLKRNESIRLIGFSILIYLAAYLAIQAQIRYTIPVASGVIAIGAAGLLSILPMRIREVLP